jgi:hypothetical protein
MRAMRRLLRTSAVILSLLLQPLISSSLLSSRAYADTITDPAAKIILSTPQSSAYSNTPVTVSVLVQSTTGQPVVLGSTEKLSVQSSSSTGQFTIGGVTTPTLNQVTFNSSLTQLDFSYMDATPGTYTLSAQLTKTDQADFTATTPLLIMGPQITNGYFNTHSVTYKGMDVGFSTQHFGIINTVTVDLYQNSRKIVTNTGTPALYAAMNGGQVQVSTAFYTQGIQSDPNWSVGQYNWGFGDAPTSAVVTVTGTFGTSSVTLSPLNEANGVRFNDLILDTMPPTVPSSGTPDGMYSTVSGVDFAWQPSSDDSGNAPTYTLQYAQDAAFTSGLVSQSSISTPTLHVDNLADGTWYWRVQTSDGAGNTSAWSTTFAVSVDTQGPKITTDLSPHAILSGTNVVTTAVSDSAPATWQLDIYLAGDKIDSLVSSTKEHTTLDTTKLINGDYIAVWTASDKAGNTSLVTIPFQISNILVSGQGDIGILPQVALAPLFFAATPPTLLPKAGVTPFGQDKSVNQSPTGNAPLSDVATPQTSDTNNNLLPASGLQTSQSGWQLFGVTWYWWLLGAGTIGIIVRQVWLKQK